MCPSYIGILDIQSWWEVPSIAHFCSLFRGAFNLLDFDIEELEEALLTDGTEESAASLLTDLIVRILCGCLPNNDISASNYQMFLRRLFRQKCQETARYNPFNTDIDFQFLPLRTKVEIVYALCDFRLTSNDVSDLFRNLEAESLRVEPLGFDDNGSAYWYFYGTRLYREDYKVKKGRKRKANDKRRRTSLGVPFYDADNTERIWQVVCFTEADWLHLTEKFKNSASKAEQELYQSLARNFIPEIPRLFQEKERQQRKRLLESAPPRRTSSRVLEKIKQKEETLKAPSDSERDIDEKKIARVTASVARAKRANKRNRIRSNSSESTDSENDIEDRRLSENREIDDMPVRGLLQNGRNRSRSVPRDRILSPPGSDNDEDSLPPEVPPLQTTGRKTNNSLACATGQIVIPETPQPANSTRKKLKTSQIFGQSEEVIQTDMYKVLEQLKSHDDAWPFMDPVEEEYAPNYYTVIRRPMDLKRMEERLDCGHYSDFAMFKADFKLIVNNCRLYNGQNNEYTAMVDNLQIAFERLTEKYLDHMSSSDEEIAVEFQLPESSYKRKKRTSTEEHPKKKKKSHHHSERKSRQSAGEDDDEEEAPNKEEPQPVTETKRHKRKRSSGRSKSKSVESPEKIARKEKHKRKKHKRDGSPKKDKHNHDDEKTGHVRRKHSKKHSKDKKSRAERKSRQKKRREKARRRLNKTTESVESPESLNRSRSATPLPSIYTPSPSPTPQPVTHDVDFYKDKYDKIKERRRQTVKDEWDLLDDSKLKACGKTKSNLLIQEKDKNQKLRETIEKLKAKNEKYKQKAALDGLFDSQRPKIPKGESVVETLIKNDDSQNSKSVDQYEFTEDLGESEESQKSNASKSGAKTKKPSAAKNESATEALEQAVKDISKWLEEGPKIVDTRSNNTSSPSAVSVDEIETSKLENDSSQSDKEKGSSKKDAKKRSLVKDSSRSSSKRREVQRTIERLQPGKSKGNLIGSIQTTAPKEEVIPLGPHNKPREPKMALTTKDEGSPKLSLGTVLTTVGFKLGIQHQFANREEKPIRKSIDKETNTESPVQEEKTVISPKEELEKPIEDDKIAKEDKVTTATQVTQAQLQEKATPNLSAWFKAFGAPKGGTTKKKSDETDQEEKPEIAIPETKAVVAPTAPKQDAPEPPEEPNVPDGGESPTPNMILSSHQRRTSTGSSISERSSFSQDLDSPRHQISHPSPLIQSPSSPRMDEFQKATYVAMNGTIRAGFYQDTASIKSSPEKSCSPREAPQSPYSAYTQHVYATGSNANNANVPQTPNYFGESHNKSPLPTYGLNQPPPYYDSSKVTQLSKTPKPHDDYTALGPDSPYQQQLNSPFSPSYSPHSQHSQHSPYSHIQHSPQTYVAPAQTQPLDVRTAEKVSIFPVKKRSYNETEAPENTHSNIVRSDIVSTSAETSSQESPQKPTSEYPYKETQAVDINNPYSAIAQTDQESVSQTQKQVDMINMGYNNKVQEQMHRNSSVDMINMGYLMSDTPLVKRTDNDLIETTSKTNRNFKTQQPQAPVKAYDAFSTAMSMGYTSHLPGISISKTDASSSLTSKSNQSLEYPIDCHKDPPKGSYQALTYEAEAERLQESLQSTITTGNLNNWKMDPNSQKKTNPNTLPYQSIFANDNVESNKMKANSNLSINIPTPNISLTAESVKSNHSSLLSAYNMSTTKIQDFSAANQMLPSDIRVPNPRASMDISCSLNSKSSHPQKKDNVQPTAKLDVAMPSSDAAIHNLSGNMNKGVSYKNTYAAHSSIPMEASLRSISNIPQILDQYGNDERLLSNFQSTASLYHDKNLSMSHLYNKSSPSTAQAIGNTANLALLTQSSLAAAFGSKDISRATTNQTAVQPRPAHQPNQEVEKKGKSRKKKPVTDIKQTVQGYHSPYSLKSTTAPESSLGSKTNNVVPGSAFNFGPSPSSIALGTSIYGDNQAFLEDFRNTTANQLMAANYIAAAVQQRNNSEAAPEKVAKPAHQNSHVSTGTYPFIGHQVRQTYPFVGMDTSQPIYQQYLQRHQEELLRQTGAQMMGLYPPGYPGGLNIRQPYDPINRPSWL